MKQQYKNYTLNGLKSMNSCDTIRFKGLECYCKMSIATKIININFKILKTVQLWLVF